MNSKAKHTPGARKFQRGPSRARLIAAASEMYAALKFLLSASDCDGSNLSVRALNEAQNEARAALSKATP